MASPDIELMAHLMRRAGVGATRAELEERCAKGYEATVEELLHPESQPDMDLDLLYRLMPDWGGYAHIEVNQPQWLYRLINSPRPLMEKVVLFCHGLFCTGHAKVMDAPQIAREMDRFRQHFLGNFRNLLLELSRDAVMLYFLDNNMSHKDEPNENWGRELLELFSMGVGNYTEDDVLEASRAFTGWTVTDRIPVYPYGRYPWFFKYDPSDHDDGEKTFLGQTGRWNGDDIIDIIVNHPSTARFIARRLFQFFVSDSPDEEAIEILAESFIANDYEMRPVLRTLFNSDFFKESRFTLVKSPAELVAGVIRTVGDFTELKPGLHPLTRTVSYMGQDLYNPPTVEGWHTGRGWIDSGTLVERINFAAEQVGNTDLPGVRSIVERVASLDTSLTPEALVDACLDQMGPLSVAPETRQSMIEFARQGGSVSPDDAEFAARVAEILQLVVATQEFQFA